MESIDNDRPSSGLTLVFQKDKKIHLDPFELLLWLLLMMPVGITVRDAWLGQLPFRESIERIALISGLGGFIRLSPTDRVSNLLSSFDIGKK
ncbi:hypothetical protein GNE08_26380 [Trichormus variabilis ARAD]|nr:hypothetical protein [Trichormus variabilis]MBC1217726.1 hypothetical protein [Trichormus variabilis ARAD]MBC1258983.1 hypothetical protein [Trichormus variabilis V5]MBC1302694.1 hypothetical protein [Trichormus variabilis N2B]MBC1324549.1 hypothetical protein [Trichormus variabilis 9RC]MBC1324607.1 hypothetical protein [Trichormus variabilis 9RC]